MVKKYIADVISQVFPNINRLADNANYFFASAFAHESQVEGFSEDNEETKTTSENVLDDQAARIDKDGNKMNC